jgi:hypothetical protein
MVNKLVGVARGNKAKHDKNGKQYQPGFHSSLNKLNPNLVQIIKV